VYPQPTEWQRIGNQIDATLIFAGAHFVNVLFDHRAPPSEPCSKPSRMEKLTFINCHDFVDLALFSFGKAPALFGFGLDFFA
jgi:hypothetical protein